MTIAGVLSGLGSTPDAVAAELLAAGITGVRQSAKRCPVANFLRFHGVDFANVGISVRGHSRERLAETPDPVVDFMIRFDGGQYAYLDATSNPDTPLLC